jgi:hypothetical protein
VPILPIDLQTIFAQMSNVGKEQAVQKEVPPLHQALQGSEIVRETDQQDHSVNHTHDVGDGLEKVREESEQQKRRREREEKEQKEREKKRLRVLQDPDLGKHIDLIGSPVRCRMCSCCWQGSRWVSWRRTSR